jgi:hypothetical protein
MKLKKKEFQDLKQGSMTVSEYVTRFTQLSLYTPNDVDTDEKKQDCFLNGLNDGLAYALEARDFENFQVMVNKALVLENRRGILERKWRQERQSQYSTNSRPRIGSSSARPIFCPMQQNVQPMPQPTGQGFGHVVCVATLDPVPFNELIFGLGFRINSLSKYVANLNESYI